MRRAIAVLCAAVIALTTSVSASLAEDQTYEQVAIGARSKNIITVDGLQFKDSNGNGLLDVYEDWRVDTEGRITDLLQQMTMEEKAALLFQCNVPGSLEEADGDSETVWNYVQNLGITHMLDNNFTGTPDEEAVWHNAIQEIAEDTRLGIPMTISSDRQYNAWSSYIDSSKSGAGPVHDIELMRKIWEIYAKEVKAVGVHVTLQPNTVEMFSFYGDDPAYIADMIAAEVASFQNNGVFTCVKHYISYQYDPRAAVVDNMVNYTYCWQSAIDAGTRWIMNGSAGIGSDELNIDYSEESIDYLRNELGYDGVLLTDWGAIGNAKGFSKDGRDLAALTNPERYAWVINNGVDQLGITAICQEASGASGRCYSLDEFYTAVNEGMISMERLEEAARRVLRTKFDLGLFENPYTDPEMALALAASAEYIAERWEFTDTESVDRARNPELVELEYEAQAKSATLIKNDNILPLSMGSKVYVTGTNNNAVAAYKPYIGQYGTAVEAVEDADVVVVDCTRMDDAAEEYIEEAKEAGKKLVVVGNCVQPDEYMLTMADAVLYLSYDRTPDHGVSIASMIHTTMPSVYVDMLFGVRQPGGRLVAEIARNGETEDWADLSGDNGASMDVRMLLQGIMLTDERHSTPVNFGDPLFCRDYGMTYDQTGDFEYASLVVPQTTEEEKVHLYLDVYKSVFRAVNAPQKSGEPFTVYAILINNGLSDITNVQIKDGENVIDERMYAVNGGSWRVIKMDVTLEGAGEHLLTVGDLSTVIMVN